MCSNKYKVFGVKYKNKVMEKKIKNAIIDYQCSGCVLGDFETCFKSAITGAGCGAHRAGTYICGIGSIFLGLPKGFNRLGEFKNMTPFIFESYESWSTEHSNTKFNVPVWKHLNKDGHTLIRGIQPRKNFPYIHIILENCMDKFDCIEITENDINEMD